MTAKNRTNKAFERILFPADFSSVSENAASFALSAARQNKARLVVMHVVDVSSEPAGFYVPHLSYEILDEEMEKAASVMLERFSARFFKGYKNIELSVSVGVPYKVILKAINDPSTDMIVMGSSGRGKVDRFLFGSTTERVLRKAACPVLIIPPAR